MIRGQVAVAATPGQVPRILLSPPDPPVHPAVLDAIRRRTGLVRTGSWYTA